jgi:hypothetical protein
MSGTSAVSRSICNGNRSLGIRLVSHKNAQSNLHQMWRAHVPLVVTASQVWFVLSVDCRRHVCADHAASLSQSICNVRPSTKSNGFRGIHFGPLVHRVLRAVGALRVLVSVMRSVLYGCRISWCTQAGAVDESGLLVRWVLPNLYPTPITSPPSLYHGFEFSNDTPLLQRSMRFILSAMDITRAAVHGSTPGSFPYASHKATYGDLTSGHNRHAAAFHTQKL